MQGSDAGVRARLLTAAALGFGAAATVTQALLIREFISVAAGLELSLGVVFASWLLGVGAGGAVGGRTRAGRTSPAGLLAALSVVAPAQIAAVRCARLAAGVQPGIMMPPIAVLWTALVFTVPAPFLVGLTFTALCRARGGPRPVGGTYILESLGSAAGGAAFTFILAGRLSSLSIASAAALLLAIPALSLAIACRARTVATVSAVAICLHGASIFSPSLVEGPTARLRWRSIAGDLPLMREGDTRYQHVSVGGSQAQVSVYGNGHLLYSAPDPYTDAAVVNLALCQHPQPRRVLILGGSAGLARAALDDPAVLEITHVTLDERLASIAGTEPDTDAADPRLRTVYADGRRFLSRTDSPFDLIIVAVGDPATALENRYFTADFCRGAKGALAPGGVLATSVGSALDYVGPEVALYGASVWRTLSESFRHVAIVPGQTTHLFASDEPVVVEDAGTMEERYKEHGTASAYFDPALFATLAPAGRAEFVRTGFRKAPPLPPNTDGRPITYYLNALVWSRMAGADGNRPAARLLQALWQHARPWHFLLLPVAALAFGSIKRSLRFATLWTIAVTGACGMSLSLTLLFAFQNLFGYLYAQVGFMVGLFMLGLGAGGWAAMRLGGRPAKTVAATTACLATLLPAAALLSQCGCGPWLIACLLAAGGVTIGMAFPLAAGLLQKHGLGAGRTAGAVEAADHLGAAAGAALTGTVLFPLFGTTTTCLLMACWALSAVALLALARAR